MEKESFILYSSFYEPIKALKNEQLGRLLRAIFNYTINGEITQEDDILIAFMFIKNEIDKNNDKWQEEKRKRSEAGKKGMASRWNKSDNGVIDSYNKDNSVINTITNITDNVYVDVNDNVNVNDNVISSSTTIYDYIQENFGRTLNSIECEEISNWEDNELTRYAIKQTVLNGVYNIKYISRILESYKVKKITTVQQAQEEEKKRKQKKEEQEKYRGLSFKEQEYLRQQEMAEKWVRGEI